MSDKPSVLRLRGITKRFPGVVANKDVSLEVYAGEVHGLLGENGAGKTTLMNIVTGLVAPDAGTVEIKGQPVALRNPLHAKRLGIAMVHQHFMLVPTMTVAENVAMGLETGRLPLSRLRSVSARVKQVSERYGLTVDPAARIEDISVGERQRVEIVRLLFRGADLLIFDEPTGVLTPQEWRDLAVIIGRLAEEGKAIIFITHKLDELLAVAGRCTVMRDGEVVGTTDVARTDKSTLARMMVGREVVLRVVRPDVNIGDEVLVVRGLTFVDEEGRTRLDDIELEIRRGEILGIAGVDGNGQRELIAVLSGLLAPTRGEIWIDGDRTERLHPPDFIRLGGAVIHADRRESGIALDLTVQENLIMSQFAEPPFSRHGWLQFAPIRTYARRLLK
jgi:general nucleoside transport system ATP-binding protein